MQKARCVGLPGARLAGVPFRPLNNLRADRKFPSDVERLGLAPQLFPVTIVLNPRSMHTYVQLLQRPPPRSLNFIGP